MPSTITTSDNDMLGHNDQARERLMQRKQEEQMDQPNRLQTASTMRTKAGENGHALNRAVLVGAPSAARESLLTAPSIHTTQIEDFGRGRRLALQFSTHGDGSLHMEKVVIDGQDRTEEALRQGGAAVRVESAPCHLFAPSRSDCGLGWQRLGKFGTWLRQVVSG